MRSLIPNLLQVLSLVLVIATGTSGVAFADHCGSHGGHCTSVDDVSTEQQHLTSVTDTEQPEHRDIAYVSRSCIPLLN